MANCCTNPECPNVEDAQRWRLSTERGLIQHDYKCIRCGHEYTPGPNESEDCPVCGCDGTLP